MIPVLPDPSAIPRLMPDQALPRSTYVPGRTAKLLPAEYQLPETDDAASCWRQSRDYSWGCELFNHGYYWEAHEVWEGLWHRLGRVGAEADFLKGLIKLAAAGVKLREGKPAGVVRHCQRAAEIFASLLSRQPDVETNHIGGLSLRELMSATDPARWRLPSRSEGEMVSLLVDIILIPNVQRILP